MTAVIFTCRPSHDIVTAAHFELNLSVLQLNLLLVVVSWEWLVVTVGTEAVLEMLSDMETDNGIDSVYNDSNSDSICSYDEIYMNSYFEESEDESVSMDVGVSRYSGRVAVRGLGQQMSRGGSGNRGRGAGRVQQRCR